MLDAFAHTSLDRIYEPWTFSRKDFQLYCQLVLLFLCENYSLNRWLISSICFLILLGWDFSWCWSWLFGFDSNSSMLSISTSLNQWNSLLDHVDMGLHDWCWTWHQSILWSPLCLFRQSFSSLMELLWKIDSQAVTSLTFKMAWKIDWHSLLCDKSKKYFICQVLSTVLSVSFWRSWQELSVIGVSLIVCAF